MKNKGLTKTHKREILAKLMERIQPKEIKELETNVSLQLVTKWNEKNKDLIDVLTRNGATAALEGYKVKTDEGVVYDVLEPVLNGNVFSPIKLEEKLQASVEKLQAMKLKFEEEIGEVYATLNAGVDAGKGTVNFVKAWPEMLAIVEEVCYTPEELSNELATTILPEEIIAARAAANELAG